MKRAIAFVVYYVALAWILYSLGQFARTGSPWEFLFAPLVLAAAWWIAAGIGIRLGVYPSDFFRWFGRFTGVLDPPKQRSGSETPAPNTGADSHS